MWYEKNNVDNSGLIRVYGIISGGCAAKLPRSFFGWDEIVAMNRDGYWPYTPNMQVRDGEINAPLRDRPQEARRPSPGKTANALRARTS